jgi:hypothetical protein
LIAMTAKKIRPVYQLKVTLRDIEPPIWRRLQVLATIKLPQLHRILQLSFGWEDYHLHEFVAGRRTYSVPDPDDALDGRKIMDEGPAPLNALVGSVGETLEYHYDFGDNWRHDILLEGILLPEAGAFYPRCVAGARNAPPEDAGGPPGYARYLDALADPDHEQHDELLAWRGPFDAEAFALKAINASLKRAFYRRSKGSVSGAATRVMKTARVLQAQPLRDRWLVDPPKKRIAPDATLPLELTNRERELILEHSYSDDDLTRRLRIVPPRGKPAVVRYTLEDLDQLSGDVAFQSNHADDRKLRKEWQTIFDKISTILDAYTDEED